MEMEAPPTGVAEEAVAEEAAAAVVVVAEEAVAAGSAGAAVAAAALGAAKPEKPALLPLKKLSELPRVDAGRITPRTKRTWDLGFLKPSALTFIDTIGAEDLSKLSQSEVQRQAVIFELISTEESYNKDLDIVKRVFLAPIRERQLLTKEEVSQLFANIEAIIELNKEFLKELRELQVQEQLITSIGPLLLKWIDKFVIYLVYCSNHSYITERLRQFKALYPSFVQFTEECFRLPECRLLYLDSYLIAPLQRICKYPLLFRELEKHTEEGHADFESLQKATKAITNLLLLINDRTRQAENIDRMIHVNSKLEFKEGESMELITARRVFIKEGAFNVTAHKKQLRDVQVYLFNDMMLITKKRRPTDSTFQVLNRIPLNAVLVRTQKDAPHIQDNEFEVVHMGDVVYTFEPTTQTTDEIRLWVSEVDKQATAALEAAVRFQENRIAMLGDSPGGIVTTAAGRGSGGPSAKVRLEGDYSAFSPQKRPSLLNFFRGGSSDSSGAAGPDSPSEGSTGASTKARPKSGGFSFGRTLSNSNGNSGLPLPPVASATPLPSPLDLPSTRDATDAYALRSAKEVLRESLKIERRLKLEAQEKVARLDDELEQFKKKYRALKEKTNLLDRVDARMSVNYDGKREVDLARSQVKELRQERNVLERELHYQREDSKHLSVQLQALTERAEMHQQLLSLYSQQVANLIFASSLTSTSSPSLSPRSSSSLAAIASASSSAPLSLSTMSPMSSLHSSSAALSMLSASPFFSSSPSLSSSPYSSPGPSSPGPSSPSPSSPRATSMSSSFASVPSSRSTSSSSDRRSTVSPHHGGGRSPPRRRSTSSMQRSKPRQPATPTTLQSQVSSPDHRASSPKTARSSDNGS